MGNLISRSVERKTVVSRDEYSSGDSYGLSERGRDDTGRGQGALSCVSGQLWGATSKEAKGLKQPVVTMGAFQRDSPHLELRVGSKSPYQDKL